jgi:hypothetical protein
MPTETEVKQEETPSVESQEGGAAAGFATAVWHLTERVARWAGHQVMRPRARTLLVGVLLILIAALFVGHSFWTAPLVVIGVVMIIVAWVGSRLEGRFAIEWSELGTGFEMHARFKSANPNVRPLVAGAAPAPQPQSVTPGIDSDDDDVIEGEAHTMEIPAEELRALVAALEQVVPQARRTEEATQTHTVTAKNGNVTATYESADER